MPSNIGFLSYWINQLMVVWILVRVVALWLLFKRRIAFRHWGVTLWLGITLSVSLYRIWAGINSKTGYYYAYKQTEWIVAIATAILIVGVFWVCVSHFRAPWILAAGMAAFLGGGAVVLAVKLAGDVVGGLWDPSIGALLARGANAMLGATIFLLLSRAIFFVLRATPLSINSRAALGATTAMTSGVWAIYGMTLFGVPVEATKSLTVLLGIVVTILFARLLPSGEIRPPRRQEWPNWVITLQSQRVIRIITDLGNRE